jgi:hypothetical protein
VTDFSEHRPRSRSIAGRGTRAELTLDHVTGVAPNQIAGDAPLLISSPAMARPTGAGRGLQLQRDRNFRADRRAARIIHARAQPVPEGGRSKLIGRQRRLESR